MVATEQGERRPDAGGAGTADRWPIKCRACHTLLGWRLAGGGVFIEVAGAYTDSAGRLTLPCPCGRSVRLARRA